MRRFEASPRRATPKGQTFINCTAPPSPELTYRAQAPAFVAHTPHSFCCSVLFLLPPQMLRAEVSGPAFPRSMQQPQIRLASPVCRTPPGLSLIHISEPTRLGM